MLNLTKPDIRAADRRAILDVLRSGHLVQGERVAALEQSISRYTGARHAAAVSNCTAALHLSLLAIGIEPNDRVLVSAFSWPATANVIEHCGARPVFVDIDASTYNIDEKTVRAALDRLSPTEMKRTKALIAVHAFGNVAPIDKIARTTKSHGLKIVEDAACALGSTLNGKMAGTLGTCGCFSFHPRKNITTGEGGIVVTGKKKLIEKINQLRNHGVHQSTKGVEFVEAGYNYRLTDLQAALGQSQLQRIEQMQSARTAAARYYDKLVCRTNLIPQRIPANTSSCFQSYVVLLPKKVVNKRSKIIQRMKEVGIETTIGTWHVPLLKYYRRKYGYGPGDFNNSEEVFKRAITLPLSNQMRRKDQQRVIEKLVQIIGVE